MNLRIILVVLVLLTGTTASQTTGGELELFDSALVQVGMTRDDVRFHADELEVFQGFGGVIIGRNLQCRYLCQGFISEGL